MRTILIIVLLLATMLLVRSNGKSSDSQRLMVWQSAVESINERPWFGVGAAGFANAFRRHKPSKFGSEVAEDAHNDILHVFATCGLFAVVLYMAWNMSLFAYAKGPFLGALVAIFVLSKFNPVTLEALVIMAVLGAICLPNDVVCIPTHFRVILATLAVLLVSIVTKIGLADYQARKGRFDLAVVTNPYEITYKTRNFGTLAAIKAHIADIKKYRPDSEYGKQVIEFGSEVIRANAT